MTTSFEQKAPRFAIHSTPQDSTADRRFLGNLEVLRFIAAVIVVLHHVQARFTLELGLDSGLHPAFGAIGPFGVDLFFVISGFVIALNISNPTMSPYRFAASRVARIVPTYWFLTCLAALTILLLPGEFSSGSTPMHFVGSMLFSNELFGYASPVISLGWTLNLEMIFYTIVALALFAPYVLRLPSQLYVLAILGLYVVVTFAGANAILYEFIFGFVCFGLWKILGTRPILGYVFILMGFLGLGMWLFEFSHELPRWLNFGVPGMFIVLGSLLIPQAEFPHLKKLGFSSYSIYLTQWFSIPLCVAIIIAIQPSERLAPLFFILTMVLCTFLGVLYSLIVDQKLHSLARKALRA